MAVTINASTFPDANWRNWVLQNITGGSTTLTDAQINSTTEINVSSKSIASLKGIEYFTKLTQLNCGYNQLTSLDVSKNTALTSLGCVSNQLKALDVSKNTALTVLFCISNQLTTLDVSKNTALKTLYCYSNKLTSLNASGATALTYVECEWNQLTSLNVSGATALTFLRCHDNQLTALDVSTNTYLTTLRCEKNQLTTLNAGGAISLKQLDCQNNQLTSLDVSKNTVLTQLQCYSNQLTSLDVSKHTALTYLSCHDNQLTTLDVSNTKITNLSVDSVKTQTPVNLNYVVPTNTEQYPYVLDAKYIPTNLASNVASLVVKGSSGSTVSSKVDGGSIYFSEAPASMTYNYVVRYKDSSGNQKSVNMDVSATLAVHVEEENFPDANFRSYVKEYIANGAESLSAAQVNYAVSIQVVSRSISDLKGIEYFRNLTSLYCSSNQLASLDVSKNTALTTLNCYNNTLTLLDVSKNTQLTELTCGSNKLTDLDVSKNTKLTRLECYSNQLTTLDVSGSTALTELRCESNQLSMLDVSTNSVLSKLNCYGNLLTSLNVNKNTRLTQLYCYDNQLTALDVSKNTNLTNMYCFENQLASLDVSKNTKLEKLWCQNNRLVSLDVSSNEKLTELTCGSQSCDMMFVSYVVGVGSVVGMSGVDVSRVDVPGMSYRRMVDSVVVEGRPRSLSYEYEVGYKSVKMSVAVGRLRYRPTVMSVSKSGVVVYGDRPVSVTSLEMPVEDGYVETPVVASNEVGRIEETVGYCKSGELTVARFRRCLRSL